MWVTWRLRLNFLEYFRKGNRRIHSRQPVLPRLPRLPRTPPSSAVVCSLFLRGTTYEDERLARTVRLSALLVPSPSYHSIRPSPSPSHPGMSSSINLALVVPFGAPWLSCEEPRSPCPRPSSPVPLAAPLRQASASEQHRAGPITIGNWKEPGPDDVERLRGNKPAQIRGQAHKASQAP